LELEVAAVCRTDSMKTVARELAEYILDLMGILEVRWDKGDIEPTGNYTCL
jgi:hypothetical protein